MLLAAAAISAGAVLLLARFAHGLGIIDEPGGRKSHARSVPLVGGLAIFGALLAVSWAMGLAPRIGWFLFALSIVVAVGFWDDRAEIRPGLKFAIQIIATGIMIWGAGVVLTSVGDLIGWRSVGLSVFAVPLTVFAMVGVVNSINMMDGLDGLAGSIALVALAWFALVAAQSGLDTQVLSALLLCGAVAGFLVFNLRLPWQRRARVFLGDAGSLMLGFALGWYAIDLTQGPGRTFPPIAALWILMLPLCDCVSLMIRRIQAGRSPFVADSGHIHHYLLARGFSPSQTLAILVAASVLFGAAGYFAWLLKLPEQVLFYPFFFDFFAYHAWIQREWERIERRAVGIPSMVHEERRHTAPAA
ncbi:MAG TPA: MraY family glycosyltransferase [Burkholderiales bacterium]|nr:MraY family glycosyltransferase [Burkholderiales bacterium]